VASFMGSTKEGNDRPVKQTKPWIKADLMIAGVDGETDMR